VNIFLGMPSHGPRAGYGRGGATSTLAFEYEYLDLELKARMHSYTVQ